MIIGVGKEHHGDDAVGLYIVRQFKKKHPQIPAYEVSDDTTSMIHLWKDQESVVIVDAMRTGLPPGTIRVFDTLRESIEFARSTHGLSVAKVIELATLLKSLPRRFILYGIEGKSFAIGTHLSSEVRLAANRLISTLTASGAGVSPAAIILEL